MSFTATTEESSLQRLLANLRKDEENVAYSSALLQYAEKRLARLTHPVPTLASEKRADAFLSQISDALGGSLDSKILKECMYHVDVTWHGETYRVNRLILTKSLFSSVRVERPLQKDRLDAPATDLDATSELFLTLADGGKDVSIRVTEDWMFEVDLDDPPEGLFDVYLEVVSSRSVNEQAYAYDCVRLGRTADEERAAFISRRVRR